MTTARYLAITSATFCGLILLAFVNAWVQQGTPTRNGYYTCAYVDVKIARGNAVPSPKLVVISGSNALQGIDVETLSHALSIRGFNMGLSASYGPGYQLFEGRKVLRAGDAALLPFEYLAYDYSTPRSSLVDAVYSCGTDYWRSLDIREKLFFMLAVRPQRIFDSWRFRSKKDAQKRIRDDAAQDVDPWGENLKGHDAPIPGVETHKPLEIGFDRDAPGPLAIAAFMKWAKAHNVTVFATWPNTLYCPQYKTYTVFGRIRDFYRSLGVDVVANPEDSMFPGSLMSGTVYHLSRAGIVIRTQRLIEALKTDPGFETWRNASSKPAASK
jgi:hypothetical protein